MEAVHTVETGVTQNVILCAFRAKFLNVKIFCTVSPPNVRMSLRLSIDRRYSKNMADGRHHY
jgi:hypothetical protein